MPASAQAHDSLPLYQLFATISIALYHVGTCFFLITLSNKFESPVTYILHQSIIGVVVKSCDFNFLSSSKSRINHVASLTCQFDFGPLFLKKNNAPKLNHHMNLEPFTSPSLQTCQRIVWNHPTFHPFFPGFYSFPPFCFGSQIHLCQINESEITHWWWRNYSWITNPKATILAKDLPAGWIPNGKGSDHKRCKETAFFDVVEWLRSRKRKGDERSYQSVCVYISHVYIAI